MIVVIIAVVRIANFGPEWRLIGVPLGIAGMLFLIRSGRAMDAEKHAMAFRLALPAAALGIGGFVILVTGVPA